MPGQTSDGQCVKYAGSDGQIVCGSLVPLPGSPLDPLGTTGLLYVTAAGVIGVNASALLSANGNLTLGSNANTSNFAVLNCAAGGNRQVSAKTAGVNRWIVTLASTAAETGADAGSDFNIAARADAGAAIDSPITIMRAAAGLITIGGNGRPLTLALTDGGLRINGQTNGAGAGVGTLTNAPRAGNPGFWVPLNIAGAAYGMPAWLL